MFQAIDGLRCCLRGIGGLLEHAASDGRRLVTACSPSLDIGLAGNGYEKVFSMLLTQLVKDGAVKGEVVSLDSTAVKAYSQRSLDNKTGKSDHDAHVGRGEEASF